MKVFYLSLIVFYLSIRCVECDWSEVLEKCDTTFTRSNILYKFNTWVLVPFDVTYKFAQVRVQPAIEKALDDVRHEIEMANKTSLLLLLKETTVKLGYNNTKCDAETATKVVADLQDLSQEEQNCNANKSNVIDIEVILGMTCDYAAGRVATLGNHWNWLLIYPGTRTHNFDEKENSECCSTMVRPGITRSDFGDFIVKLYKRYDWNTSVVVYTVSSSHSAAVSIDSKSDCSALLGGVTDKFRGESWERYRYYNITYRNTDREAEDDLELILNEIKLYSRVSLWCVGRRTMRRVMKTAENLGMTSGDFAFIYVDLYNTNTTYYWSDADDQLWEDTSDPNDPVNTTILHTDDYLRSLTVVTLKTPLNEEYREFSDYIKHKIYNNSNGEVQENNQFINPFIAYYYDGMKSLLHGIIESQCSQSINVTDGEQFAASFWGSKIKSLGRNISMTSYGDRLLDYSVLDMNVVSRKFEVVSNYYGATSSWEDFGDIDWPENVPPKNVPDCGYQEEKCREDIPNNHLITLYSALFSCVAALLVVCAVLVVLFRRMQREKRLQKMSWKVRYDELEWTHNRRLSSLIGSQKESSLSIASSGGSHPNFTAKQVFTKTAYYKDELVAVKDIKRKRLILDRSLLVDLEEIYAVDHEHICKFIGAIIETPHVSILTEYCVRGSLQDLLEDNTEYEMEEIFKKSLLGDIINGMHYLHKSYFKYHGNLKSSNCLIDSRFLVKLTDYGLTKLRQGTRTDSVTGHKYYENKLWTAPELLRGLQCDGTPKGDVYSFAIVAQEIIYRKGVFYTEENHSPQEILHQLTCPTPDKKPLRPTLEDDDTVIVDPELRNLVQECWQEDPHARPDFSEIYKKFKKMKREKNLVDSLLKRLEHYSLHLEEKVEERTEQYKAERERADTLLYQMLPKAVADQLKKGKNVLPMAFDQVTIFFSDIVGFTAISHNSKPMEVVNMLNDLYTMFDRIIDKFDVYKVETIGDAYMVVSGLPEKNGNKHAREIARMALSLLDCVKNKFKIKHMPSTQLKLRVGMHSGPVVAGVVGQKMPRYCLFGDTVNTASRMESNGKPFSIHVSPLTKSVLDNFGTFHLEERKDEVFLKGLGTWKTWWLTGEDPHESESSSDIDEKEDFIEMSPRVRNIGVVTFETDCVKPKTRRVSLVKQNGEWPSSMSPASIMKDRQKQIKAIENAQANSITEKRHRLATINSSRLHELTEDDNFRHSERKAKIAQLNSQLSNSNMESDLNKETEKINSDSKVHFYSSSTSLDNSDKVVRISGRDSGIELGFDNPTFFEDPSSEDDYL